MTDSLEFLKTDLKFFKRKVINKRPEIKHKQNKRGKNCLSSKATICT